MHPAWELNPSADRWLALRAGGCGRDSVVVVVAVSACCRVAPKVSVHGISWVVKRDIPTLPTYPIPLQTSRLSDLIVAFHGRVKEGPVHSRDQQLVRASSDHVLYVSLARTKRKPPCQPGIAVSTMTLRRRHPIAAYLPAKTAWRIGGIHDALARTERLERNIPAKAGTYSGVAN